MPGLPIACCVGAPSTSYGVDEMTPAIPVVSIVAPMFNEEGNVACFVSAVEEVMLALGGPFEIILVDDGSQDGTWERIAEQSRRVPYVRGISLSRNFGHQNALFAGLHHARGRAVISM